ncbi:jg7306 [Pararge aegeria aegeria]|uniref:Jg7306 protein n=1 Tax=Pararge aegeria aegeria TaxID=348720 RepID=A0A8S4RFD8_9NEOP|nr:jg7306 [Pararge aegeria aegeria]
MLTRKAEAKKLSIACHKFLQAWRKLPGEWPTPAWFALCSAHQEDRLQVQQNKRLILGALRYVRIDVINRDTRTPIVEVFVRTIARHMFAHADYGPCEHLHGIAPALDRPITGRLLPRELLQSAPPARQRVGTNGDIDDARPIGIDNIPGGDFADSDAGSFYGHDKPTVSRPMMAGPSP